MSYILDALKRAERERNSAVADTGPNATVTPPRSLRPTTVALAGATLFLAGIGVAALLLRPDAPIPATATTDARDAAPAATPSAEDPVAPAPPPAVVPDVAELGSYESLDDVAPVFQGRPVKPAAAAAAPVSTQRVETEPPPDASSGSQTPAPKVPAQALESAQRQLPPRLAEMPDDFQSRFPALALQVHVFDADPARRWIMAGSRRHGEGSMIDGGVRVVEILDDGVIFEFDGSRVFWPLNR